MENSHKILISLVGATLLLTAGNFAVSVSKADTRQATVTDAPSVDSSVKITDQGQPKATNVNEPTGASSRTYSDGSLTFEYPLGWHMYTRSVFDNPRRINAEHVVYLDKDPISFHSPSDGPGLISQVTMTALDEGEAIYAPYEGIKWKEYLTNEVTINGRKATRLQLTAPEDMAYMSPYTEVLFIGGYEVRYEASTKQEADADKNWSLIKNSITIK